MAGTLRSSASVSVAVLSSRVLGVVRDAIFAAVFGVSMLTDAYIIAFRIPNLLRDLFAEGALSSAFVPTFSNVLAKGGQERAFRLGNLTLSALVAVTGTITLIGIFQADGIVSLIAGAPGTEAAKLALTVRLTRIMMPILILVSISAVWMGMLNAQERYLAPAYAPAMFNVTSILCGTGLVILGWRDLRGIIIWSVATTAAGLVQAMVQLPVLWRLGYRPRLMLAGLWRDEEVRRVFRLMGPATIGLAAIQINVLVNTYFAAALGTGPQTYLNNAFRLFYLPIGLFGVALATVTTARMSADAARGDREALMARVSEGVRGVWLLALPSAIGLIVLAEPVIAFLFERGRFRPQDTAAMVPIVQAYMLGVLPYSLVKVYAPAFFTINRPRVTMVASMAAVAANLAFNALSYRRLGATGLALGTTLAALVNVGVLRLAFGGMVGRPRTDRAGGIDDLAKLAIANLVLGGVAWGAWTAAEVALASLPGSAGGWAFGAARACALFGAIAIAFVIYTLALRALRIRGAEEVWQLPARIVRRLWRR